MRTGYKSCIECETHFACTKKTHNMCDLCVTEEKVIRQGEGVETSLGDESPGLLPEVLGGSLLVLGVEDVLQTGDKVDLLLGDVASARVSVHEPIAEVENDEEGDGDVVGDKVANRPVTFEEGSPTAEEHDESG